MPTFVTNNIQHPNFITWLLDTRSGPDVVVQLLVTYSVLKRSKRSVPHSDHSKIIFH